MASPTYTVLVTGSSGHLGAALMLTLPSQGHTPLGLDIRPSETTTVVGSVTDRALVASLLARHSSIVHIVHAATLHKPHVESHPPSAFVDTNITGTLVLLEEAEAADAAVAAADGGPRKGGPSRIRSFVFVSTTSTFGAALAPAPGRPAAWIDESVAPVPKNIYGVTKRAAEDLCALAHRRRGLPVVVLRAARFFPEADDDPDRRASLAPADDGANLKVCELACRRADIADVASAVACAMERAVAVGFGTYIISAPPPFLSRFAGGGEGGGAAGGGQGFREGPGGGDGGGGQGFGEDSAGNLGELRSGQQAFGDAAAEPVAAAARRTLLRRLDGDAGAAFRESVPGCAAVFESLGWGFLGRVDRVYDSSRATRDLGWTPEWTFEKVVERLARGEDWRSGLTHRVGKRGYHAVPTGVYTTR
ncbi:NAD dependent epimerase/dehydratase [Colletotrichum graminicola]|uniref:NAD dependent epimerase/dehydratase n=1 Tax=Colletotrichum graminicola (strain M1.001 / M2 / FGSC 10212) TaxID=645133 RepID=E3QXY8_COLGM|nr:NAD dependent epimerase/dehydratase [Colletotrichum graminicola M1.001]EFQ35726.1 NAD dependent epimerase/dehydratase [Colletotrichum graminicola M1.001]WDK10333.1 NAD dependent epimerase/dehydratase [Colletotrichum graminicola]